MRLSESLKKNIMESSAGRVLNKFKIKARRDAFFFEDILAEYVKECEDAGYENELQEIGKKWMNLVIQQTLPSVFKKTPMFFLNNILKKLWTNLGLIDDIKATKDRNIIKIDTKNEALTRSIGKNTLIIGSYIGILNVLFGSEVKVLKITQTKKQCEYFFRIENKPYQYIRCKEKDLYNKLNERKDSEGYTLRDALKKGIIQLDQDNKIFFRGKRLIVGEPTLSHLISNSGIMIEKLPFISYNYFNSLVKKDTSNEEKLFLIKVLIQVMGWGNMKIIESGGSINISIKDPPYGFQIEKDNWDFLNKTTLGYLWLLDRNFKIKKVTEKYKNIRITFSPKIISDKKPESQKYPRTATIGMRKFWPVFPNKIKHEENIWH